MKRWGVVAAMLLSAAIVAAASLYLRKDDRSDYGGTNPALQSYKRGVSATADSRKGVGGLVRGVDGRPVGGVRVFSERREFIASVDSDGEFTVEADAVDEDTSLFAVGWGLRTTKAARVSEAGGSVAQVQILITVVEQEVEETLRISFVSTQGTPVPGFPVLVGRREPHIGIVVDTREMKSDEDGILDVPIFSLEDQWVITSLDPSFSMSDEPILLGPDEVREFRGAEKRVVLTESSSIRVLRPSKSGGERHPALVLAVPRWSEMQDVSPRHAGALWSFCGLPKQQFLKANQLTTRWRRSMPTEALSK